MKCATFRFYAELNDFLKAEMRHQDFEHSFWGSPSVKEAVEALGVPHTEVDLILVNGESVGFTCALQDGDRVSVYPVFEGLDIGPVVKLRPEPLRHPRFVLDIHLGRLAAYLRMLGFDTVYRNDHDDEQLVELSRGGDRALLTKDRGLLKRSSVTHGYYVRTIEPRRQIQEVLKRFDLFSLAAPFSRCMHCNGWLEHAAKQDVIDRLPPRTSRAYDDFRRCQSCRRIYWKGPHYRRMQSFVQELLEGSSSDV